MLKKKEKGDDRSHIPQGQEKLDPGICEQVLSKSVELLFDFKIREQTDNHANNQHDYD